MYVFQLTEVCTSKNWILLYTNFTSIKMILGAEVQLSGRAFAKHTQGPGFSPQRWREKKKIKKKKKKKTLKKR
jgi:hypothetical protein